MRLFFCLFSILASPWSGHAQDASGEKDVLGKNVFWEAGFHLGNLLPNQIKGVTEITGLGGARMGLRMGPDSFGEVDVSSGNENGVKWTNLSARARIEMPVESMVGIAYVGPDVTYYQGAGQSGRRVMFGGHVGGGIMSLLGGSTWFRADMKFAVSPGTSLYIGAGFVFRFAGGGSGGG